MFVDWYIFVGFITVHLKKTSDNFMRIVKNLINQHAEVSCLNLELTKSIIELTRMSKSCKSFSRFHGQKEAPSIGLLG